MYFCLFICFFLLNAKEDSLLIAVTEKVCDSFAFRYFDQRITSCIRLNKYKESDFQKVQPAIEKFGKEMFNQAGFSNISAVQFYTMKSTMKQSYGIPVAIAEPFGVFLNEDLLTKMSYGHSRFVLFHEAMHIKYNHHSLALLTNYSSIVAYLMLTRSLVKNKTSLKFGFFNCLGAAITASVVNYKIFSFCEKRADIHAVKRLQCTDCAIEAAITSSDSEYNLSGYLNRREILEYNSLYNSQNKICSFHSMNRISRYKKSKF